MTTAIATLEGKSMRHAQPAIRHSRAKRMGWAAGLLAAAGCLLAFASSARADFSDIQFSGGVFNQDGTTYNQAGGHPYSATTTFTIPSAGDPSQFVVTNEDIKDTEVDLPPGFVGNPLATPTRCSAAQLAETESNLTRCPPSSQVGVVEFYRQGPGFLIASQVALYNVVPPPGIPALFAFKILTFTTTLVPRVRTGGDYGLTVKVPNAVQSKGLVGAKVTLWGDPADPSHDTDRGTTFDAQIDEAENYCAYLGDPFLFIDPASEACSNRGSLPGVAHRAFLTLPSDCSAGALSTVLRVNSWQNPGVVHTRSFDHDTNGNPAAVTNCGAVPFDPQVSVAASSHSPDSPTGLDVELSVPQEGLTDPALVAQANLKRARVVLPEGMTISPSGADGLKACSDTQLGLDNDRAVSCPDASKVGSVSIETSLLDSPLSGSVFVRSQASDDPVSGEMFRIAIVVDSAERGVRIKLAGQVAADPVTGRLVTTFDDNPQVPFSSVKLHFEGGARAPLATPPTCGTKEWSAQLSSWSAVDPDNPTASETVTRSGSYTVDCPGLSGFAPVFGAGTISPAGGGFSPFVARIDRPDRQGYLSGVAVDLPQGLLAKLKGVPLCPDANASAGDCPGGSRVGSATVGAGPGSNPFFLTGQPVYLTGPYKGAPYGLSVVTRALAGPFDLGTVVVRQRLVVDPEDAHVTVVSDRLPTIVKGVPLRLRTVAVTIDRKDFTLNPTSCAAKRIRGTLTSTTGQLSTSSPPFQATGCKALPFSPKLKLKLTGANQTAVGKHPGLLATLTQKAGQANIKQVTVALPLSLALDPDNAASDDLCSFAEGQKPSPHCPKSSIIGTAKATTPVLDQPLTGNVYFVKNVRKSPTGNLIRTLPTLLVALRGQVAINLRANTNVKHGKLLNTFKTVPDAPVTRFALNLHGGKKGILVVTGNKNLCQHKQTANTTTKAHNNKHTNPTTPIAVHCKPHHN